MTNLSFNPRSPHGERRDLEALAMSYYQNVSIHAPRMGSDTATLLAGDDVNGVSIHAPRMGSD